MTCPSCGNSDIRLSRHSYWSDTFQSIFGRMPYRCRKCRQRFYSSEDPDAGAPGSKKVHQVTRDELKSKRRKLLRGLIAIAIFAAMFLIFLLILNYLTADKGPPKEFGGALHRPVGGPSGLSQPRPVGAPHLAGFSRDGGDSGPRLANL